MKISHKYFEAQGSQISYNDLHDKEERCNNGSHSHGQHNSLAILKKMASTKNQEFAGISKEILGKSFETKDAHRESRQTRGTS